MRNERRKQVFVDPEVQGSLVRRILLYWAASTLLATVAIAIIHLFASPDQGLWEHLARAVGRHWPMLLMSAAILPLIMYDAIRFSHRFAGPIIRMRRALSRYAQGEPIRPLQFRRRDFWKDLVVQVNVLLNRVEEAEARAAAAERQASRRHDVATPSRPTQREHAPRRSSEKRKVAPAGLFPVAPPRELVAPPK